MARALSRGEIWLHACKPPDKRRPVLIIGRQALLDVLETATVVPITTTLRGSPTEVALDMHDGLKEASCANLANIVTVRKAALIRYVGTVRREKLAEVCRALRQLRR
jgi:mRNA interferase MazF